MVKPHCSKTLNQLKKKKDNSLLKETKSQKVFLMSIHYLPDTNFADIVKDGTKLKLLFEI